MDRSSDDAFWRSGDVRAVPGAHFEPWTSWVIQTNGSLRLDGLHRSSHLRPEWAPQRYLLEAPDGGRDWRSKRRFRSEWGAQGSVKRCPAEANYSRACLLRECQLSESRHRGRRSVRRRNASGARCRKWSLGGAEPDRRAHRQSAEHFWANIVSGRYG
jgi:hypothetical protein